MTQPVLFNSSMRLTVSELTRYLRRLFERDESLQDVWVQGETLESFPARLPDMSISPSRTPALRCDVSYGARMSTGCA